MNRFLFSCFVFILLIHGIISATGHHIMQIDWYFQFMNMQLLHSDFWNTVLYFHANPPGLSLLYYFCDVITNGNKYVLFEIVFPLLHCLSLYFFYHAALRFNFRFLKIALVILFFNPLVFIYFRYAFYATFIFITTCGMLYVLFSDFSAAKKLLLLAVIFSINSFLRTSWHIVFCFAFLVPFFLKAKPKQIILAVLILSIPFSVYIKNYFLFNHFTTSTWMGMNLPHHSLHVKEMPKNSILSLPTFGKVDSYREYFSEDDPLISKYKNVVSLNEENYNNVRYIPVSDRYLLDYKKYVTANQLTQKILFGIFAFFNSPADNVLLFKKTTMDGTLPIFCYDYFNLPDFSFKGKNIGLSLYFPVYILVCLLLILHFRKFSFELKWLAILCLLFSAIYISVDPAESNRMRFEIEPLFYFFIIYFLSIGKQSFAFILKNKNS